MPRGNTNELMRHNSLEILDFFIPKNRIKDERPVYFSLWAPYCMCKHQGAYSSLKVSTGLAQVFFKALMLTMVKAKISVKPPAKGKSHHWIVVW